MNTKKYLCCLILILIISSSHAQCWKSVSAGSNHTLAIKNDGTLWG